MKYLILGLGSMGRRRIRCLSALGVAKSDIFGYDVREDRRRESKERYGIVPVADPDTVVRSVDLVIISTPPDCHLQCQHYALDHGKSFFCESGLFRDGMEEVLSKAEAGQLKAVPSKTAIVFPERKTVKKLVSDRYAGSPLAFSYHAGCFLPHWHRYEKITDFYASKRACGGAREMLAFQMTGLRDIFGDVRKVFAIKGKVSPDFQADIDDIYNVICVFENNVTGNIIADVIARPPSETFELTCSNGRISYDAINETCVWVKRDGEEQATEFGYDRGVAEKGYVYSEGMYVEELKDAIDHITMNKPYGLSYEDELKTIRVLEAAELSADKGRMIEL